MPGMPNCLGSSKVAAERAAAVTLSLGGAESRRKVLGGFTSRPLVDGAPSSHVGFEIFNQPVDFSAVVGSSLVARRQGVHATLPLLV